MNARSYQLSTTLINSRQVLQIFINCHLLNSHQFLQTPINLYHLSCHQLFNIPINSLINSQKVRKLFTNSYQLSLTPINSNQAIHFCQFSSIVKTTFINAHEPLFCSYDHSSSLDLGYQLL